MSSINQLKKDIAEDIRNRVIFEIERDNLIHSGQLKNSWEIKKDGEDIIIGSRLIWAAVMEWGRTPGSLPPPKVLFPWVLQKLGGKDEKDIMRKAWAVAKSIERKGIEGRRYLKRALFLLEADTR